MDRRFWLSRVCCAAALGAAALAINTTTQAQGGAQMLDPALSVRTVVSGLTTPIGVAFLGPADLLVLEKDTGRVRRIVNGNVSEPVLDLVVNRASERGLLGIALHPDFPQNPGVYLFWTCRSRGQTPEPPAPEFVPRDQPCRDSGDDSVGNHRE
jgi:glucose/arabinose dehydrogenase